MEAITKEKALSKLADMCSKREIYPSKATELMKRWGVSADEQQEILEYLTLHRYIDPKRYATLFVREKCRMGKWGRRKIVETLYAKRISKEIIAFALDQEYKEDSSALIKILKQKKATVKGKDDNDIRNKLIRFGLSRGFDFEDINSALNKL